MKPLLNIYLLLLLLSFPAHATTPTKQSILIQAGPTQEKVECTSVNLFFKLLKQIKDHIHRFILMNISTNQIIFFTFLIIIFFLTEN